MSFKVYNLSGEDRVVSVDEQGVMHPLTSEQIVEQLNILSGEDRVVSVDEQGVMHPLTSEQIVEQLNILCGVIKQLESDIEGMEQAEPLHSNEDQWGKK